MFSNPSPQIDDLLVTGGASPEYIILGMDYKQDPEYTHSFFQTFRRALSHLPLQKCAFGIIISGGKFRVICLIKSEDVISMYSFESYIHKPPSFDTYYRLIPEKLTKVVNWIYWILDYYNRQMRL